MKNRKSIFNRLYKYDCSICKGRRTGTEWKNNPTVSYMAIVEVAPCYACGGTGYLLSQTPQFTEGLGGIPINNTSKGYLIVNTNP